ncbi:MAG: DNA mismatch repair protein MutS [Chloroflexia bacterium]
MARAAAKAEPYGELVRQYLALRDAHPGVLLLFRVGSFYEVLFDDAELVARELGLKLTDRPSGGSAPPVPQCGFAHHALDAFLPRLLARGYRVAVGEEGEDEGSGLRRRAVVRTLTPGTVTDPRLLREDRPTYLAALVGGNDRLGLAWADAAAGEFKAGEFDPEEAAAELQRLDPAEVLVSPDRPPPDTLVARRNVTPVKSSAGAAAALRDAFPNADLSDLPQAQAAAGLVARYFAETQGDAAPPLDVPTVADSDDGMRLDASTQRHLELVETERGREHAGSLLATLDRTVTPMGRRMVRAWVLRPLTDLAKIATRQRIVSELVADNALRTALGTCLAELADLERLAGRAAARRATPGDLNALATIAAVLPRARLGERGCPLPFLRVLGRPRPGLAAFAEFANDVLSSDDEEGTVRQGLAQRWPRRPSACAARPTGRRATCPPARPAQPERVKLERTGTQGLFLEVPTNTPVPADWIRRGTVQRAERYTTPALDDHAAALADAETIVAAETKALLDELRAAAAGIAGEARDLARYLAAADASFALATVAAELGWVRPVVDDSLTLTIDGGRHPVLDGPAFNPNDAHLCARGDRDQLAVLTGPNMAGKSTWMRQVALLVLLAQVGSFVPARSMHVGLVDAIFTRIGAVDDLVGGRSTFMVEMLETATVLRGATDRSLVLLDEIGRGTSTHDGMAIAWAVIEHLVGGDVRPRAIVATHYHELAALRDLHPPLTLLRAAVEEHPGGITFPHRIEPGAANRSFGIEVARLAGLPPTLLARARAVADAIEPLSAEIGHHLGTAGRQVPGR